MHDAQGTPNRLAAELSPYLLLHRHNPVDWYPWGEEALARARQEDKPIFLSVGYATCYWCHVMERESFADPATAELMNRGFVSIKLDREERPDLDEIYMAATQLLSGQGGWPNSLFLTPDLKPFFTGTYFPPQPRHGLPAFSEVLRALTRAWRERRHDVVAQGEELATAIRHHLEPQVKPGALASNDVVARAASALAAGFDEDHGGFGAKPKFPTPANLYLLEALLARGGAQAADSRRMLDRTLEKMALGGIFDQLGGGFHRYAVDQAWKVPHFEKMLYDNGHLLGLYARAHARTGLALFARVARQTAAFLDRELSDPEGGFHAAIDAETAGFEGGFHAWTAAALRRELGAEDYAFLAPLLGFDGEPFFEGAYYVLHLPSSLAEQAARRRMSEEALLAQMAPMLQRLLAAREKRPRPRVDDKVLADWNGMAISGLAAAGHHLGAPALVARAARAAHFVLEHMRDPAGRLHHCWRQGRLKQRAMLGDFVFSVRGLLDLDAASDDPTWLAAAVALADAQHQRLWDNDTGGYFVAPAAPDLLARSKDIFDSALPSGNAVAAINLIELAQRTGEARFRRAAERLLRAFGGLAEARGEAVRMLLVAIDRFHRAASAPAPAAGESEER